MSKTKGKNKKFYRKYSGKFGKLLEFEFTPGRFIVISRTPDARISMAQQIAVIDGNADKAERVWLKNPFVFDSVLKFIKFREELNKIEIINVDKIIKDLKEGKIGKEGSDG